MQIQTDEARIILAMEAVRSSSKMSIRRAATLYEVPRSSLAHRLAGRTPRNETKANCHKLTEVEEEVIVRIYIGPRYKRICAPACWCRRYGELYT